MAIEWSPDASRIAVASLDHGRSVLDIVRTDGSGSTRLDTDLEITDLAWRPQTGESLVVRGSNGFTVGLYMLDKDGAGLTMLDTRSEGLGNNDYWAPAWSPDGKRLAFDLSSGASQPDTYELRTNVVDASPTGLVTSQKELRFDEGDSDEGWPIWSPTGDGLLINASVRGSEVFRVAVGSSDGFGRLILTGPPTTKHEAMEHRWSPDGRQIMTRYWEEKAAWLLDPAGGPGTEVPYWATLGRRPELAADPALTAGHRGRRDAARSPTKRTPGCQGLGLRLVRASYLNLYRDGDAVPFEHDHTRRAEYRGDRGPARPRRTSEARRSRRLRRPRRPASRAVGRCRPAHRPGPGARARRGPGSTHPRLARPAGSARP